MVIIMVNPWYNGDYNGDYMDIILMVININGGNH
jgi:hypothetical protein